MMKKIAAGFGVLSLVLFIIVILPTQAEATTEQDVMYSQDYDIKTYWSATESERTAPVLDDYVFGGWYIQEQDGSYTALTSETAAEEIAKEASSAYAKFVPENVLSVKAQNENNTVANDGNGTSIRLLSSVDDEDGYQKVGFHILLNNKIDVGTCEWGRVYEKVKSLGDSVTAESVFGYPASHFNVWRLNNINDANDSKIIYVRPYWITWDGTKVEGLAKYVHVEDDYNNYISVPVNLLSESEIAAGAVNMTYDTDVLRYLGFENGRLLENMQEPDVATEGTIKMVGYASTRVDETSANLNNVNADGIYANVRFALKEGKSLEEAKSGITAITVIDFCDWAENLVENLKVRSVIY